ncbi:MAG TPA: SPFH domain-containing protein [Leptospiraceae bacterium]|nr:SPFH domain-containing protein [Leptospiraceae bacterium]HMW06894.1 SPFH domain-containing protein [Leptospiraceae bacterium]HMX34064.1 SPFH domain-containing protein [Leptospiraceae bacterium]HMY32413.1 SPFH domain-containing protein [Leptospiraceae bacterium]HMZ65291.1 SPFH domain-containing protein [Leptospiraceae bacterium]
MGIFDKLKGEFIDVIEYTDDSLSGLVHRFERHGNEIKNGAQLTVRESQTAIFVNEGEMGDVFKPGRYELTTKNIPILTTLKSWKYGLNSPFKAEVYFVNTKIYTGLTWGTKNPIMLRDPEFRQVQVRAFGTYSIRVNDPIKLVKEVSGTSSSFDIENVEDQLRSLLVSEFTDALAEMSIPVLDVARNFKELGAKIQGFVNEEFGKLGLEVTKFIIENISLPPNLQKFLDEDTGAAMVRDVNKVNQMKMGDAMLNASQNEGAGGVMGMGMGAGMGMAMGQQMGGMGQQQQTNNPPPIPGAVAYFVAVNGQQQGPFNLDQLKTAISNGQITRDSLVWKNGMANWVKAGDNPETSGLFGSVPPPLPPQQ